MQPPTDATRAPNGGSSPPWGVTTKAIVASVLIILTALVIWRFQFLITPLAVAAIIAYLFNPIIGVVQRRTGMRRMFAVLAVYAVMLLIVAGSVTLLGYLAVEQGTRLWQELPSLAPQFITRVQNTTEQWQAAQFRIGPYLINVHGLLEDLDLSILAEQLQAGIQPIATRSGLLVADLARGTISTASQIFLILVVAIYLSNDVDRMGRAVSDIAHQPGYRDDADRLMTETLLIWNAYLRGQIILALVIGVVVSVVLAVLGVSNWIGLGILAGVMEFLPVVGPTISTVAAVLVAVLQTTTGWGMSPLVYGLVVLGAMLAIQMLENNLLVPRIVGDALDLHPIAVIVSVVMGASLAGLLGAILAAPVVASLKLYGVYIWRKMLDLPPFAEPAPAERHRLRLWGKSAKPAANPE